MLLIISRCAGVFLRNTLKPSVLSSTECHSFLNRNSSSFPELHGASFVLALFSTLPRFRCVSICSLTARHYPCFPLGPSLHWPLAATRRLCHRQFSGRRGAGHRRGDAKDRMRPDHGDQALSYYSLSRRFRRRNRPIFS